MGLTGKGVHHALEAIGLKGDGRAVVSRCCGMAAWRPSSA